VRFVAEVVVTLKPVVNDPQGLTVRAGLHQLGFAEVSEVRVGKHLVVELEAPTEVVAAERVTAMCEQLLRNPVIEDYAIGLRAAQPA
jgi:phosphoribosylformylglycinamidine synthase